MNSTLLSQIEKLISNQNTDEKELLFHLKKMLHEVEVQSSNARESKSISTLVSENLNALKNGNKGDHLIPSGFKNFDDAFGGFSAGEFVVIGGRPSMGKSQLLVNLALNISVTHPILYFTFDLSQYLLTTRFISALSDIAVHKILQNDLQKEEEDKLLSIEGKMDRFQLFINESCNSSMSALKAHCKKMIEEQGVKVIMVDYIQKMGSSKYRYNRESEISYISGELKNIAIDNNVCVIAASQLSRAVETRMHRRPQLSDLRESGAIEQDADKVILIYRPEYYGEEYNDDDNSTEGLMDVIMAKNRNGVLGTIQLIRNANFTNYKDYESPGDFNFSKNRLAELRRFEEMDEAPF